MIIEIKRVDKEDKIEKAAKNALKQIEEKKYEERLKRKGIKEVIKIGIAFYKKRIEILWKI